MTMYYIIRPTDELMQLMEKHNIKGYSWSRAQVWTREESPSQRANTYPNMTSIKVVYLIELVRLYNPRYKPEVDELLFGNPPVFSITNFDKWWTVERIGPGADYVQIMTQATVQQLKQIVVNDDEVAEWLAQIIQYKEEHS